MFLLASAIDAFIYVYLSGLPWSVMILILCMIFIVLFNWRKYSKVHI